MTKKAILMYVFASLWGPIGASPIGDFHFPQSEVEHTQCALPTDGVHKFYLSVCQVQYDEEEDALQVIMRIFTDDLELTLFDTYGEKYWLDTEKEIASAGERIGSYAQNHIRVWVDGKEHRLQFVGHEYELDQTIVYLELPNAGLANAEVLELENDLLLTSFEDQKNMTHLRFRGIRKTWVFRQGYIKEKLNLR